MKTKVAVAMSGGVDSAVAACLLKKQGYEVIGLTMQLASPACCGLNDVADAKKTARSLGIRHYVIDFKDIFREYIIDNFIEEYRLGRTPNPCIRCNKHIKFDYLLSYAKDIGAKYLATGHYARIIVDRSSGTPPHQFIGGGGKFFLKKGIDNSKDQSYVLYCLNQMNLRQILMPLGDLTKREVKEIAKREKLPKASNLESQELCFIDGDYRSFLEKENVFSNQTGFIKDSSGNVLGRHRGMASFTIGQRHGLGISSRAPLYVLRLNFQKNEVVVGPREEGCSREFTVGEVNMISGDIFKEKIESMVKVRYRHAPSLATIIPLNSHFRIVFKEPQRGITPGQSAVFYDGEEVLGGGIINIYQKLI